MGLLLQLCTGVARRMWNCCPVAGAGFATVVLTSGVLFGGVAEAQNWNCADPGNLPQQGMNFCAHQDYLDADVVLNSVYGKVRGQLAGQMRPDGRSEADVLRDAQLAWITFRDLACDLEGAPFRGGSMEPFLVSSCLARLTRARTSDLLLLDMEG